MKIEKIGVDVDTSNIEEALKLHNAWDHLDTTILIVPEEEKRKYWEIHYNQKQDQEYPGDNEFLGFYSDKTCVIFYHPKMGEASLAWKIMHELTHAILSQAAPFLSHYLAYKDADVLAKDGISWEQYEADGNSALYMKYHQELATEQFCDDVADVLTEKWFRGMWKKQQDSLSKT